MFDPNDLQHPIVQAPMGGGPSTPELAAAVCEAGGVGFLAAGYRTVADVAHEIDRLRSLTQRPFGLNLFAPPGPAAEPSSVAAYAQRIAAEGELGQPRHHDDAYVEKLALAADRRVALVSTTFGTPSAAEIQELHAADCAVWVTITTPAEARQAAAADADALVVQGTEAGGHRASFDDAAPGDIGLLALLQLTAAVTDLPLIASGGIVTGAAVAGALAAGAVAVQLGTAFMLTPEAGTSPAHRAVIARPGATGLTRAFTGRTARGIINRFQREYSSAAPSAYPEVHHLTAPVRAAARARGDLDGFHLWAGETHELARELPAGDLVRQLAAEARAALGEAADRMGA
jgi:nitronate monooxygenase